MTTRPASPDRAKEHPILFSSPMVLALLADRKHATRRLDKKWLKVKAGDRLWVREGNLFRSECDGYRCRVATGESWGSFEAWTSDGAIHWENDDRVKTWDDAKIPRHPLPYGVGGYSATKTGQKKGAFTLNLLRCDVEKFIEPFTGNTIIESLDVVFRRRVPPIHFPRRFSRILLECEEDARIERLRDITEEEAIAEGCSADLDWTATMRFAELWSTLHAKPGERWQDNPDVVRVGRFRRIVR